MPGAFNPVHDGHWGMSSAVSRLTGLPVDFELSVTNVDKLPLAVEAVRERVCAFAWRAPVWLSRAPTFLEKSLLFPGTVFVLGVDTAERLVAPRYYGGSEDGVLIALEQIRQRGCRFLVAGRTDAAGSFQTLAGLNLPEACRDLFDEIPAREFSLNVSSSELRRRGSGC